MRINPPIFALSKGYERYKLELLAWREVPKLARKKLGIAIALTWPNPSNESNIRENVFEQLTLAEHKADNKLDRLIEFFDKYLENGELLDSFSKVDLFVDYKRQNESNNEYVLKCDQNYAKIRKGHGVACRNPGF